MKLRNKKTGGIVDFLTIDLTGKGEIEFCFIAPDGDERGWKYNSLEAFNEEWEDYKPAEPLIKDEKIRKAVKAWAEAEGETQVQVTHCRKHILSIWSATKENGNIDFDCDIEPFGEGFYNINQLCGEEDRV